jgi:UPF0716 protein FxsA
MPLFLLIIFLPLLEIAGFIAIGGRIGVGLTLLWVIADTIIGFSLLSTLGAGTMRRARQSAQAEVYPFEEMFEGFCIIAGALLLIFPGFISDFLALPLLLPPLRRGVFLFLKRRHKNLFDDLGTSSRGFTSWYYEERGHGRAAHTIEGEFRKTDNDKRIH